DELVDVLATGGRAINEAPAVGRKSHIRATGDRLIFEQLIDHAVFCVGLGPGERNSARLRDRVQLSRSRGCAILNSVLDSTAELRAIRIDYGRRHGVSAIGYQTGVPSEGRRPAQWCERSRFARSDADRHGRGGSGDSPLHRSAAAPTLGIDLEPDDTGELAS